MAARLTAAEARRLGVRLPRMPTGDLHLPDLPGPPGIERVTERMLQRQALPYFRRVLPPGSKVWHTPNERSLRHLSEEQRRNALFAAVADGMDPGALDLNFAWDASLGSVPSRGVAWVELKRPVKPAPVSAKQVAWIRDMRAIGHVAGWAQSLEQIEALLVEAGAPLSIRLL